MSRPLLAPDAVSAPAQEKMAAFHGAVLSEVREAVSNHPLVVVGMAQNPFVKKARKALTDAGFAFKYLEYGSYFSKWKERLAIKMWSGWPTFPQIYVHGELLGGHDFVVKAIADGTLKTKLDKK